MSLTTFWMLRRAEGNDTAEYTIGVNTELPAYAQATCQDSAMPAGSRRSDLKLQGLKRKVCIAMPKGEWAGAAASNKEQMSLSGSQPQMLLKQLDALMPAQGSQYLWWAWDRNVWSCNSPSRHDNAAVDNSQHLGSKLQGKLQRAASSW